MSVELIVTIAAIIISWLIFSWVIKVLKMSISTVLMIAAILIILQLFFGIRSQQIGQTIIQMGQQIWQFLTQ